MILITYDGRQVALAGRQRFYLAPDIAARRDGDALKTFVCFLTAYAHDVMSGLLPDEPGGYVPARAERYARECLLPSSAFQASAHLSDTELAAHFNVPPEQISHRRAEVGRAGVARARPRAEGS